MNKLSKKLNIIKCFFIVSFLGIAIYLIIFNFFEAKYIYSNSYNKRLRNENTYIVRGDIQDRNDIILATSKISNNSIKRDYIYSRHFSHVIGYHSKQIGSTGIEALYDKELSSAKILDTIKGIINGKEIKGNTVKLTLDKTLQVYASELLGNRKGSIVALNPKTGEILALVSKPDFNPSKINANWKNLIEDENSPLLNRALDGLYPPGSIFKIITTSAALYGNYKDYEIDCTGSSNVNGYEIKDSNKKGHGNINLNKAFTLSCNSYFVNLGLKLGNEKLYNEANKFLFNKSISGNIIAKTSRFNMKYDNKSLASQSIGQGDVLITPLHAAVIASIIANDGMLLQPYIVSEIKDINGKTIKSFKSKSANVIIDADKAKTIKEMMVNVVKSGTGKSAKISGIEVAGKTGTAENPHGKPHSWFIGFAPAEDPQIAIAVIIENGGSGGSNAAPIAGKVMKKAISVLK
ncbi:peptidoglycan D,D-transpeptidase FtsI family protein [Lutispora thermophila]|uniref:Peptidoglycan glycosyltransferase n=1 Tax=Lutispora thermophila DSM 19022 TaxID=1122184 RepID=A0A1M6GKU5_9FIRM|nr:penicillin-binding transpeptidase domain-containing protein [Lutispora thermophila]SHJ10597.1 peptidoglycan glycosyltransferase [Lutispora thermophila DSM 19022]